MRRCIPLQWRRGLRIVRSPELWRVSAGTSPYWRWLYTHTHCHAQQTKHNHRTVPVCFHISQLWQTARSPILPLLTLPLRGRQTYWNGLWRRCRRTWSRYTMLPWPLTLVRVWQERRPAPDAAWTPSRRELPLRLEVPLRYRSRTSLPTSNYILNQNGGNVKSDLRSVSKGTVILLRIGRLARTDNQVATLTQKWMAPSASNPVRGCWSLVGHSLHTTMKRRKMDYNNERKILLLYHCQEGGVTSDTGDRNVERNQVRQSEWPVPECRWKCF
jgi:hypothetical protein